MKLSIAGQAAALALALGLGLGLGLVYDLLRPPRYRGKKWLGRLLDFIFAAISGAAMFTYAMTADQGQLGLWELTLTLLGFLLYMYTLSPYMLKFLEVFYRVSGNIFRCAKEKTKNIGEILKKLFPNAKECFKIKK